MYVSDIPNHFSKSLLNLFADDTKCLKAISDPSDVIELLHDINSLDLWSEQWELLFNPTKLVRISFKSNLQIYTIERSSIGKVDSHKDLGIILSSNHTWDAHYDYIYYVKLKSNLSICLSICLSPSWDNFSDFCMDQLGPWFMHS